MNVIQCPNCKQQYEVKEDVTGGTFECAVCGQRFTLEQTLPTAPAFKGLKKHLIILIAALVVFVISVSGFIGFRVYKEKTYYRNHETNGYRSKFEDIKFKVDPVISCLDNMAKLWLNTEGEGQGKSKKVPCRKMSVDSSLKEMSTAYDEYMNQLNAFNCPPDCEHKKEKAIVMNIVLLSRIVLAEYVEKLLSGANALLVHLYNDQEREDFRQESLYTFSDYEFILKAIENIKFNAKKLKEIK